MPLVGNPYGVAGLIGNLYAESGLMPDALESTGRKALGMTGAEYTRAVDNGTYQNFVSDGYGYGLAQWTYYQHKQQLLDFARARKKSIGDLELQKDFLLEDMKRFSSVLHVLQRSTTVKQASDDVMLRYEKPADTSDKAKERRAGLGQEVFDRQFKEGGNAMVSNTGFCAFIQEALKERWGYIWGKYGQTWTQKDQDNTTNEMAIKYGQQWVGHRVADCSGLGYWAFRQLGGECYHGSNTIWNEYVKDKAKLVNGKREDGQPIWPGDPVFIYKDGRRTHIGYYMGGGMCIEAQGTQTGVVTNMNGGKGKPLSRWDETAHWKNMDYVSKDDVITGSDVEMYPTLRKGATGDDVRKLQELLNKLGYGLVVDGVYGSGTVKAVKAFQTNNGLTVDGVAGPVTWTKLAELTSGEEPDVPDIPEDPDEPDDDTVRVPRQELKALRDLVMSTAETIKDIIDGWLK